MTNTEQIRTKKISFILALSVIIFAAIATYFTLCHDINIMRITTPNNSRTGDVHHIVWSPAEIFL